MAARLPLPNGFRKGKKIELLQETATFKIFKLPLKVLYEDEELAVIVKPAGVATSGNYFKTIRSALPFNLQASKATDALPAPEPAHRLDKETSGLLLIAKTRKTLLQLHQHFTKSIFRKPILQLFTGNLNPIKASGNQLQEKQRRPSSNHWKPMKWNPKPIV